MIGKPKSEEHRKKISSALAGGVQSEETKGKISKALSRVPRKPLSEAHKRRLSKANTGQVVSEKTRRKTSQALTGRTLSKDHKRKISEALAGRVCSKESKRRNSESNKENWKNPEFVAMMVQAQHRKPTLDELILNMILDKNFPGEWRYTGDGKDGTSIGGRIPDFINVNGKKLVIEMFGGYWHPRDEEEEEGVEHYRTYGFYCIVIWDFDVRENVVVERVKHFLHTTKGSTEQ